MFLNPLMLFGLTAVSIPVIIHLLNKRKFKRVTWAAMRFLQAAVKKNQKRVQFEDLLLLLLRCAMVALLALALARPALNAAAGAGLLGRGKTTAVVVIDNSYSMSASDGVQARFEQAKLAAAEVIDNLPSGSGVAVMLASDVVDAPIPEPTFDLNLARSTIEQVHLCDRSSNLLPAIRSALNLLQSKAQGARELYLITDGQKLAWRQLAESRDALQAARDKVRSQVILVGAPAEQNVGVSDLRLASGLAAMDQSLRFEVQVTNHGVHEATNVRVTLRVNDANPSDEALVDRIPPGESKSISLNAKLRLDGGSVYHAVTAQLGSPDPMPADDRRTIVVRGLQSVNVLLVDGQPGREPRDSEVFYLRHALQPVAAAEADRYFVQTTTIVPTQLEQTRLDAYDAVVLANVPDFSEATTKSFANYLRKGGRGLILFPGENTLVWSYNDRLGKALGMLPATLADPVGDAQQDQKFVTFSTGLLKHPIASLWSDPASGSVAGAHFYRYFPLQPLTAQPVPEAGGVSTILYYNDGKTPAVMERDWGLGKVVLFSSPADTAWGDLAVRPGLFVPLMYRVLGSIIERQDEHLNVAVGSPFVYRTEMDLLRREAQIRRPPPEHEVPASAVVELLESTPVLKFTETGLAGVYDVDMGTGAGRVRFAVQSNPTESSLVQLNDEDVRQLSTAAEVVRWRDGQTFEQDLQTARTGTELWLPLALIALMIAAVETFLAQWFSRSK